MKLLIPKRKEFKNFLDKVYTQGELVAIYESYKAAARAVDGTSSAISRICSNTHGLHTHKGFVWKIVEDIVQEDE